VICCTGSADAALLAMRSTMERLKLTVNEQKTHVCRLPEPYFDVLGYQFGRFYSCEASDQIDPRADRPPDVSARSRRTGGSLNRMLRGRANYFKLGPVSKACRTVDRYTTTRLRRASSELTITELH
jgi:RNA-directed DNA polymerase